jgi:hypothetical protein
MNTSVSSIRWRASSRFAGYYCVAGPFVLELHKPQPTSAEHWLLKAYREGSIFRCRLWALACVDHRAAHRTARLMAAQPELFTAGDWVYQAHRVALQQLNARGSAR